MRAFEEANNVCGEWCEACREPFDIRADGVAYTEDACWLCPSCAAAARIEALPNAEPAT
jgi:hypothetical protein